MNKTTENPDFSLDRRWFTALALSAAAFPVTGQAQARQAEQAGTVDDVAGRAVAELGQQVRVLASGGTVFVGDSVSTAESSRIGMRVGSDTVIRLGERARLRIDRFIMNAGGVLTLQSGPMSFNRPSSSTPADIQIRGAFGLIAVRGTQFFAGPSRGKQGVLVLRGSVSVRSGGQTVIVNAGQGTDIVRRGARPTPPSAWGQARIDEALASVR